MAHISMSNVSYTAGNGENVNLWLCFTKMHPMIVLKMIMMRNICMTHPSAVADLNMTISI